MGYLNTDVVGNEGELLTIQSPVESPVSSLIAHISPKQEGEGTPSLENVRPITGRTGCWVTQSGTNIGDKSYYRIGISSSWGGVRKTWGSFAANNTRVHFLFRVPQGSTITMACHNPDKYWVDRIIPVKYDTVDFSATNNAFLGYYNIALYGNADQRLKMRTYTMPEDSDGLLIRVRMLEDNVEMTEELFEGLEFTCVLGSIPSQLFVPYIGKTLHADWTDSAGTIYGGYVDLVKGVVVQTMQKVVLDGSFNPGLFPWAADVGVLLLTETSPLLMWMKQ